MDAKKRIKITKEFLENNISFECSSWGLFDGYDTLLNELKETEEQMKEYCLDIFPSVRKAMKLQNIIQFGRDNNINSVQLDGYTITFNGNEDD